jgi:hypothetical protein
LEDAMEKVKTEFAVGRILATDVTIIEPGVRRGPLFRRGHVIEESDILLLISIGKHYVWVGTEGSSMVHEDDVAVRMMSLIAGENLKTTPPSESKVKLIAEERGILIVNKVGLKKVNGIKDVNVVVKRNFTFVQKREPVAIGKVMPKEIPISQMEEIEKVANAFKPIVKILPILPYKIALFPIGNELLEGLREEKMSNKIENYLLSLGQEIIIKKILPDDEEEISNEGLEAIKSGADFVIFMGGMAVDPDDRTVDGIELMGVEVVKYGVPLWPGQTFMIAYKGDVVVLGVPVAAGLAEKNTSFHRLMPILLSNYRLTREEVIDMAEGGFIDVSDL